MLAGTKGSEIHLPYPLPKMQNPLWLLGFVTFMGSAILLYPHLKISKIAVTESWISIAALCAMLFATCLFYGLALRVKTIPMAFLVLFVPQTLMYAGIMAIKGILLYHALPNEPWHIIQAFLIAEIKDALLASGKVALILGGFLVWSLRMRMRPAYDLTARLFLLVGGFLIVTNVAALSFFHPDDVITEFALFNFAVATLFVALSYWQNRNRAFWYRRILIGAEPAWQYAESSPNQGFLPPLFQMNQASTNQGSLVSHSKIPLVSVPTAQEHLFRALLPRTVLALCLIAMGVLGFVGTAARLVFGPLL